MSHTVPRPLDRPVVTDPSPGGGDIGTRLAGLGAITFATTVVIQNVIRGATAPGNGASPSEVLAHYVDHRSVTFVLIATYVLSGIGLFLFLGGAMKQMMVGTRRGWALTGLVGAIGITALFAVVVAGEQALFVVAGQDEPTIGAIQGLWALHNSVFAVLDLSIAVALLGLSRAGLSTGMTPKVYARLAPIGSALLVVGTLAGPAIAGGDAMPLFGLAGLGFVVWLSFLISTGVRLIRTREVPS